MALKPFPHNKISDATLDALVKSNMYTGVVTRLIKYKIEMPISLSNKIIEQLRDTDDNVYVSQWEKDTKLSQITDMADMHSDSYQLPVKFIDGIIRSHDVSMRIKYMITKVYLDSYKYISSATVDYFLEEHIYDFLAHLIDGWMESVSLPYFNDPRLKEYIETLDPTLREELLQLIKKDDWDL
jgi:hypothetical protein